MSKSGQNLLWKCHICEGILKLGLTDDQYDEKKLYFCDPCQVKKKQDLFDAWEKKERGKKLIKMYVK